MKTRIQTTLFRKRSIIGLQVLAITLLGFLPPVNGMSQHESNEELTIQPDPELEGAIDRLIRLVKDRPDDETLVVEQLNILKQIGGEQYKMLIPQLVYYSMHGDDVYEGMAFDIVVGHLKISKYYIANALLPYLGTRDMELKKQLREALEVVENASPSRPPDYSHYGAIIETSVREGKELPRELIQYMYESDPGTAVIRVMRSSMLRKPSEVKPILWAEHLVADVLWKWRYDFLKRGVVEPEAAEALAKLVEHRQWWARLYVAEILRQHPPFRTDELIEALIADPDESVRSVVASFAAKDDQPD